MRVIIARSVPILVAGVVLAGTLPAPAIAASSPRVSHPAPLRMCVKIGLPGCSPVGSWSVGTKLIVRCRTKNADPRPGHWLYAFGDHQRGFINSKLVAGRSNAPRCKKREGVIASRWAAARIGRTAPTSGQAGSLGINDGMWSGWCAAFTRAAYEFGAHKSVSVVGDARPRYLSYQAAGLMHRWDWGRVPAGSLLFWPYISRWGHTAIYAGNRYVITTQGIGQGHLPVARRHISWYGPPRGWVRPDDV